MEIKIIDYLWVKDVDKFYQLINTPDGFVDVYETGNTNDTLKEIIAVFDPWYGEEYIKRLQRIEQDTDLVIVQEI